MLPRYCDGVSRRELLKIGSIGGLSMADMFRLQQMAPAAEATSRDDINCIFLFIVGGMPQQDMWDVKPDAP